MANTPMTQTPPTLPGAPVKPAAGGPAVSGTQMRQPDTDQQKWDKNGNLEAALLHEQMHGSVKLIRLDKKEEEDEIKKTLPGNAGMIVSTLNKKPRFIDEGYYKTDPDSGYHLHFKNGGCQLVKRPTFGIISLVLGHFYTVSDYRERFRQAYGIVLDALAEHQGVTCYRIDLKDPKGLSYGELKDFLDEVEKRGKSVEFGDGVYEFLDTLSNTDREYFLGRKAQLDNNYYLTEHVQFGKYNSTLDEQVKLGNKSVDEYVNEVYKKDTSKQPPAETMNEDEKFKACDAEINKLDEKAKTLEAALTELNAYSSVVTTACSKPNDYDLANLARTEYALRDKRDALVTRLGKDRDEIISMRDGLMTEATKKPAQPSPSFDAEVKKLEVKVTELNKRLDTIKDDSVNTLKKNFTDIPVAIDKAATTAPRVQR